MKVLAVGNQKGGTGKTVTAVTLAHGMALRGLRVLLVDLDPQGNTGGSLGLEDGNELAALLDRKGTRWVYSGRDKLSVTRSNRRTVALKSSMVGWDWREQVLKSALESLTAFDLVVLDMAPSADVLHVSALVAADWLLIPAQMEDFSIKGCVDVLATLTRSQKNGGACQLAGILPTFFDKRKVGHFDQIENLVKHFEGQVWSPIPTDAKVPEANRQGRSLWEAYPGCRALLGFGSEGGGYGSSLDRLSALYGI